jgi:hypothetical protein
MSPHHVRCTKSEGLGCPESISDALWNTCRLQWFRRDHYTFVLMCPTPVLLESASVHSKGDSKD